MNALAVLSTFLLGEAQNEAWNDENNGGILEDLLEEILGGDEASAEAFEDEDSFDPLGDEELIALAASDGEADDDSFDVLGDDKLIEMAAGEFDDDYEWAEEDFGPAGRRREEEGDDRRRAVRMSSLGFGVCRTASGGAGRYKSLRTATQEQCRAQCMRETACVAFEYTFMSSPINPGWCEIHYERITKKITTKTNMCEIKVGSYAPPARMNALGFGVCRTASGGVGRYRGYTSGTQEKCRARCLADANCVALEFTFMSSPVNPGWCEIHYERITHKVYTKTNMCEVKVGSGIGRRLENDEVAEEVSLEAPVAVEADDRRRAVRMSSLGFGVCRTANGGAGRYKSLRTATQEQCRAQCMAETACVAFEYTFMSSPINPGWCEIHYERITKKVLTKTNMCEVKVNYTPPPRMSSLGFGVCRTANGGVGRYRGYTSGTQEKCRARCLADRACVAFEFTFMSSPVNPGWCEIHYDRITHKVATRTNMCEVKVGGRRMDESLQSDDIELEN